MKLIFAKTRRKTRRLCSTSGVGHVTDSRTNSCGSGAHMVLNYFTLAPQTHTQDVHAKTNCSHGSSLIRAVTLTDSPHISLLQAKLPPGANRILFVKNLNYQITGDDLYDLFGRYGSIRQIRIGNEPKTKGTAFVVFDDVMDVRFTSLLSPSSIPSHPIPSSM